MFAHLMSFGVATRDEDAEQHARDVGIENRRALSKREAADRTGSVRADAFEREQRLLVGGELAAVPGNRFARDRMEAPRPDVVAERPPGRGDVILARPGQRFERGVLLQPLVILRHYAIDLR